jgi:hypothetical protein
MRGLLPAVLVFGALLVGSAAGPARADVTPGFFINDVTVPEVDGIQNVPVFLTSPAPSTGAAIFYTTFDGTATGLPGGIFPIDYVQSTGVVFIPPGQAVGYIPVQIVTDGIDEYDETFFIQATPEFGAFPIDPFAQVTIVDLDQPPTVGFSENPSITEGDSGTQSVVLHAVLSRKSEKDVEVDVQTVDGTATGGTASPADYGTTTRHLIFDHGATSRDVSVNVFGDTNIEPTETFQVKLLNPQNVLLDPVHRNATVTIVNDDDVTPPVIAAKAAVSVQALFAPVTVLYLSPTAVDAVDGPVAVNCFPKSGSAFSFGTSLVSCQAQDSSGNVAHSSFFVVVQFPLTLGAVTNPGNLDTKLAAVSPGQRVRVTAGGFAEGSEVTLTFIDGAGAELDDGTAIAGPDGRIDARPKIPDDAAIGAGQMTAHGLAPDGSELVRAWALTVRD